ncbi:hypothetical protein BGZ58_011276, partial [Dissophora ornata]
GPPKTTQTASPGTSLPAVVIPNLKPIIPANSLNVHLRLENVSYSQVIDNGILAAQLVSFIPSQLGILLKVESNSILVLAIRDASSTNGGSRRARKRALVTTNNGNDAILVTISIPTATYWTLSGMVQDQNSALYTPSGNSFGQFVDPTFPLSNSPPATSGSSNGSTTNPLTGDAFGTGDPNLVTAGTSTGAPSNSALIGSLVGVAAAAYIGITLLVVRRYRSRRQKEQDERDALQRSISAPIGVQGSVHGWGWHG